MLLGRSCHILTVFFDLVTCFGVLDYFPIFDSVIMEIYRVLKLGGYMCVTLPNLASWHNRICLLMRYQPRDVEVSSKFLVGVHPFYARRGDKPVGHIHTVTTRGFLQLTQLFGFRPVCLRGAGPVSRDGIPSYLRIIDRMLSKSPFLARRFVYLAEKK
ncbi:methyltransferase domain-containing protein [uncultured Thermanaerothrix sp.]|uniref:methyltransferase domain-containing protein n=1 Tax=uncultured Thermanaerothrix sp. TaxID=1195149 RepID=UPI00344DD0C4